MHALESALEKFALLNAIRHGGKASAGNILGQVIREHPGAKDDMKSLQALARSVVARVNALEIGDQRAKLEEVAPELLEKKAPQEHDIFAFLDIPEGATVNTGWPPEPGKHIHIGHAKAAYANYELAKRHNGRFVLRFDDTNAEKVKPEFYQIIQDDLAWLGIKLDKVDAGSDHLDELYAIADKLIASGHCYVCDCKAEKTNELRYKGEGCEHRDQPIAETQRLWKTLKEGQVLRLRIDPAHKNTTMRDPTVFRVAHGEHARAGTKYHIWPSYDFETSLMDAVDNLTYRLRTKEFELRSELHNHIQDIAGYPKTRYYEFGRFELEGVDTRGRVIREKLESGEYIGWDDPALATIAALRRRGFTPEAIESFVLSTGLTKNEATLTWDDLYAHNRRVLNDSARRLFFVEDPERVTIADAPDKTITLSYFPHTDGTERVFKTTQDFLIAKADKDALEDGKLYRLMDCVNFTKTATGYSYVDDKLQTYRDRGERILHFLPAGHPAVPVTILMPDKTVRIGLGESRVAELTPGDIIQFERVGFCRLDAVEDGTYAFWFTHK